MKLLIIFFLLKYQRIVYKFKIKQFRVKTENMDSSDLSLLVKFLPALQGKAVLQLGAESNCTKVFAEQSVESITVVDANEEALKANELQNSSAININYLQQSLKDINVQSDRLESFVK